MKKLKEEGRILSRKEMRVVTGGYAQCPANGICANPCGTTPNQTTGWHCDSASNTCRPYLCNIE